MITSKSKINGGYHWELKLPVDICSDELLCMSRQLRKISRKAVSQ